MQAIKLNGKYKVYLLSLNPEANIEKQWDYGLLKDFFNGDLWKINGVEFEVQQVKIIPKSVEPTIVVIPARHHKDMEHLVNLELAKCKKVILFLMGDEEADFNADLINHPNIDIWVQNPHYDKHDKYNKLGTGYPQHLKNNIPEYKNKTTQIFFSGQVTHERREELVRVLEAMQEDYSIGLNETYGFTQGYEPKEYYIRMADAGVSPCPSGAVIPDSFRLFEALEMMSIPIADTKTPNGKVTPYWDWLFGEIVPFYCVDDFDRLVPLINEINQDYCNIIHKITCWWINWKREFAYKIMRQLNDN
jgi:hypothetical protein